MPVSGLVVTMSLEPQPLVDALAAIGQENRITMGVFQSNRLAIVMDTESSAEDKQLWEWLESLPGVSFVEVAFVSFEQGEESRPMPAPNANTKHNLPATEMMDDSHDGC